MPRYIPMPAYPDCIHAEDMEPLLEIFADRDVVSDRSNPNRALLRQAYVYKFLHHIFQLQTGASASAPASDGPGLRQHRDAMLLTREYIRSIPAQPFFHLTAKYRHASACRYFSY